MPEDPTLPSSGDTPAENAGDDHFIDTALHELARKRSNDDEEFIAGVELALDQQDKGQRRIQGRAKPARLPVWLVSMIAAVVMLGVGVAIFVPAISSITSEAESAKRPPRSADATPQMRLSKVDDWVWDYGEATTDGTNFGPSDLESPAPELPSTSRENYGSLTDNPWHSPFDQPQSTFATDVDTASYTNLRRLIRDSSPVPADAVRIEEMINYFDYHYGQPEGDHPLAVHTECSTCPWNGENLLLRIGIQAKEINRTQRPDANLVFLLDVSGSMRKRDKLPLVKKSISLLVEELDRDDRVSIVVYAGAEGLALDTTAGDRDETIVAAFDRLGAGGSTNGGAGIELAYRKAAEQFIDGGINRVILCTDGDFNVGVTEKGDLVELVKKHADENATFLSVLGFGTGNINDAMLEAVTNQGNGTYYYIDSLREARKVLLEDLTSTLVTVAQDTKVQIEFNPAQVGQYRLIGYANRLLRAEDFDNDEVDAGEVGAGHQVTALYEMRLAAGSGEGARSPAASGLRYQKKKSTLVPSRDLATVALRYQKAGGSASRLLESRVGKASVAWEDASGDHRFASAVALFGMVLREAEDVGWNPLWTVRLLGRGAIASDPHGRRREFLELVESFEERRGRGGR